MRYSQPWATILNLIPDIAYYANGRVKYRGFQSTARCTVPGSGTGPTGPRCARVPSTRAGRSVSGGPSIEPAGPSRRRCSRRAATQGERPPSGCQRRALRRPASSNSRCAVNGERSTRPASRIPSHGTDMLGQRYAFDLIRLDPRHGSPLPPRRGRADAARRGSHPRVLRLGRAGPRSARRGGRDGRDGAPERRWIHPVREALPVVKAGLTFRATERHLRRVLGNHVILRCGDDYAGFAHLATGTVAVEVGQAVRVGDLLGRVGHTGNSTAPHLHFQLMDGPDPPSRGASRARSASTRSGGTVPGIGSSTPSRRRRSGSDRCPTSYRLAHRTPRRSIAPSPDAGGRCAGRGP